MLHSAEDLVKLLLAVPQRCHIRADPVAQGSHLSTMPFWLFGRSFLLPTMAHDSWQLWFVNTISGTAKVPHIHKGRFSRPRKPLNPFTAERPRKVTRI